MRSKVNKKLGYPGHPAPKFDNRKTNPRYFGKAIQTDKNIRFIIEFVTFVNNVLKPY